VNKYVVEIVAIIMLGVFLTSMIFTGNSPNDVKIACFRAAEKNPNIKVEDCK
jgi:hypothetical protein